MTTWLKPVESTLDWLGEHPVLSFAAFVGGVALMGVDVVQSQPELLNVAELVGGSGLILTASAGLAVAMSREDYDH